MGDSSFGTSTLRGNGPSISLVDNSSNGSALGVGNYKGVMLCNRPFGGTAGEYIFSKSNNFLSRQHLFLTAKSNSSGKKGESTSFTCGVVPDSLGQTVLASSKDKVCFPAI